MITSKLRMLYYFNRLKRIQWYNDNQLKRIQEKKLKKLIKHAYTNVPFYHDLFNSLGLVPDDIKTINDLKNFPIITKKQIRENYPDKIVSRDINLDQCHISSTTGSTGSPLKICFSNKEWLYLCALFNLYFFSEAGVKWYDRIVSIRHHPTSFIKNWRDKFHLYLYRKYQISIFHPIENIIAKLIEINPDYIITFPSMLSLIADEIKVQNIRTIRPRKIFAMSETLSDSLREKLSCVFNADIIGHYGSEELGTLAFECKEHAGYHIIADNVIIEIEKDSNKVASSDIGEVIVTNLNNFTMPLIRYKLGDIAVLSGEKCKCGRGLPLIKQIVGREDDFIILPSGRKISPRMINAIENIPGIISYKTIQESKNRILVQLVKGNEFSDSTIPEVKKQIKLGCLGEQIEINVKLVKEIPKSDRGKIRAIVSNLDKS